MEYKDEKQIRELLDLYMNAETSLEQERQLKEYFSHCDHLPSDLEYAREMFGFFERRKEVVAPQRRSRRSLHVRRLVYTSSAVAALVVIVLVVSSVFTTDSQPVLCYINGKPVYDYDQALAQTEAILHFTGDSFCSTISPLSELREFGESAHQLELIFQNNR